MTVDKDECLMAFRIKHYLMTWAKPNTHWQKHAVSLPKDLTMEQEVAYLRVAYNLPADATIVLTAL